MTNSNFVKSNQPNTHYVLLVTVAAISLTVCPFLQKLALWASRPYAYTTLYSALGFPPIRLHYSILRFGLPAHTLMTHLCGHIFILHSRRPRPRRPRRTYKTSVNAGNITLLIIKTLLCVIDSIFSIYYGTRLWLPDANCSPICPFQVRHNCGCQLPTMRVVLIASTRHIHRLLRLLGLSTPTLLYHPDKV